MKFAHLHQHTQFSLLDGAAKLDELINWVKKTSPEEPALATTDHGNLFGAVQFYRKATAAGVKPLIGYEAYVAAESRFDRTMRKGLDGGYFHLTLLAKNFTGYQNLVRLASRAYLEGFYMKPRIDREILAEHHEGIIALSGCLGAEIPQFILADRLDLAEERLNEYLKIFGDDYFIEIQDHGLEEDKKVNAVLREFARKYGLGMVATNDGHYVSREDARAHEVLLAIQSKSTLDDEDRWKFPCDEFYVKTPEEMKQALADWPDEVFDNTVEIARMCTVDLPVGEKMTYRIPRFPLPEGRDDNQYLRELTFRGLLERYPEKVTYALYRAYLRKLEIEPSADDEEVILQLSRIDRQTREAIDFFPDIRVTTDWDGWAILARAEHELGVIEKMGFPGYLLIVQDYINWAKEQGISVGPGRGSAAGSVVTYAIRITNIDPLEFGLLFERFLNPDRVSMPDIDTDFSDVRRDEVIDYVRRRYGEDRVAQIATFGTLASKAALKDVARVYGLEYKRAEQLAKLIPVRFGKPMPLAQAMEQIPELKAAMQQDEKVREVLEIARRLEGLNRHASVHAAGVVIADEPLTNLVPLMRDTKGSGVVTQYDMGSVEALGLLKMDFLGLRTLSFLDEARRIVRESAGVEIDYDNLPLDDRKTFEMLSRGDTKGVFQLEGTGMTNTVKAFKPERLHDIIAIVSLYRPGPMDNIPAYLRRRHGQEPVSYAEFPHAEEMLRPILAETYGIPVYQEQIMQIASAVAGYSLGEADMLRRAMGKKKVEELKSQRDRFITGAEKRGVPPDEASRIFDLLEAFANYGFNKSHAAAYSLISYQTAYVKAHFPVEFMAALLTVERRNSDKVAEYIRDAEASGIHVLPPDINRSGADFRVVGREILFGLSAVKNVGEGAVESILHEREKGGPYKSLPDFLKRVDLHHVNKRALESLIKAGAFDAFGERGQMLEAIEGLLKWAAAEQQKSAGGLTGLFDSEVTEPALPQVPPLEEVIRLRYEKEALGIYVTGHPLEHFPGLTEAATCKLSELERWYERNTGGKERARALLVGMVEQITRRSTRSGGMMARFNLADASGALEVVVFGRAYDRVMTRVKEDIPVVAVCEVEPDADGESLRVVVQDVFLYEELEGLPQVLELDFDLSLLSDEEILDLRSLLDEHPGALPVFLKVRGPGGWALLESRDVRVSEEAAAEASRLPGVSARFVPNRDALLTGKLGGEGQTEVVPF